MRAYTIDEIINIKGIEVRVPFNPSKKTQKIYGCMVNRQRKTSCYQGRGLKMLHKLKRYID